MNRVITDDEVRFAVLKAKLGKAIGADTIPTGVLRYGSVHSYMDRMLNLCFQYRIISSTWQNGIINAFPQMVTKIPGYP